MSWTSIVEDLRRGWTAAYGGFWLLGAVVIGVGIVVTDSSADLGLDERSRTAWYVILVAGSVIVGLVAGVVVGFFARLSRPLGMITLPISLIPGLFAAIFVHVDLIDDNPWTTGEATVALAVWTLYIAACVATVNAVLSAWKVDAPDVVTG